MSGLRGVAGAEGAGWEPGREGAGGGACAITELAGRRVGGDWDAGREPRRELSFRLRAEGYARTSWKAVGEGKGVFVV